MAYRSAIVAVLMLAPAFCETPAQQTAAVLGREHVSCEVRGETILYCTKPFISLGREEHFALHVPRGDNISRRSVIVLLHGLGRDCLTLVSNPASLPTIENSPAFVVFPNGRKSWWIDSPGSHYESYVLELMESLTRIFHLSSDRHRWGVAGWSMGGFGSLRLIEKHPDLFGAWVGLLTLADFPNPRYSPANNHAVPSLFGPASTWKQWQPLTHAAKLRGKQIWFSTGNIAFDRKMNDALDRQLTELDIPHHYSVVEGRHELRVVLQQLPEALQFLQTATAPHEE
jgi:pimeloyl-ACP methyl ester carboxylesterase